MLMKANGNEDTSTLLHLSVDTILKRFDVGTEKPKSFGYPEPKDDELIPLRLMDITSDNQKAKNKLHSLQVEEGGNSGNAVTESLQAVTLNQQTMTLSSGVEQLAIEIGSDSSDSDLDEIIESIVKKDEEDNVGEDDGVVEQLAIEIDSDSSDSDLDEIIISIVKKDEEDNVGEADGVTSTGKCDEDGEASESPSSNDENDNLPPGWTASFSQSQKRPYYTHPKYGATWYFPGYSGWKKMYCDKKNIFYYTHPDHGVCWVCPASFYSN